MRQQRTLQSRLRQSFQEHGNRIAIRHKDIALQYKDLDRHSTFLAHWLLEEKIPGGTSIGVLMEDRVAMITCIIGITKAACVFVPLDFHYPGARTRSMLDVADLSYIITEESNLSRVKAITCHMKRRVDIITVNDTFYLSQTFKPVLYQDIYKLSEAEKTRYKRQILLDGWGLEGQERLKRAVVFVAGAGGSGSPLIQQLALCGFGTIIVCDFDDVELSNLNRQSLHDETRIGINKALSAKMTIERMNPNVTVIARTEKITRRNVLELVGEAEIIFDNVDSLEAKSVLGECAVQLGIPHIISSMIHINSYACVFHTPHTPCFHCLYDKDKIEDIARAKTNANHYEVIPNSVASPSLYLSTGFAVGESLKILLGMGAPAYNVYLHFNQYGDEAVASTNGYRQITYPFNDHFRRLAGEQGFDWEKGWNGQLAEEITIEPDPDCPVCGQWRREGENIHNETSLEAADMLHEMSAVPYYEDDRINIYFTSGTTGKPKAVVGRNESLLHFIAWEIGEFDLKPGYRVSQLTPQCHDPFLRDIFVPLCCGGAICIPDSRETILDSRGIKRWLDASAVNLVHCTPSLFKIIAGDGLEAGNFPQLRYILLAGERVDARDLSVWYHKMGDRIELVNIYGPTETTLAKLFYRIASSDVQRENIPIGKPIRGSKAVLLDSDDNLCGVGQVGEIVIRTPFRSHGYCNDPEATALKFVPNPFGSDPCDLVYRTGDLGKMDDRGDIEFIGRSDRQIKIRGFRVELEGIEHTLRRHPTVNDAVALSKMTGTGNQILVAYVVRRSSDDSWSKDWIASLKEDMAGQLPDYMIPSFFVSMDEFPLNANKKIDYKALPDPDDLERQGYVAPETSDQRALATIWSDVLGIGCIGVTDGFLDMGGNSLNAMNLSTRVFGEFGVSIPLYKIFENPTIRAMATWIDTEGPKAAHRIDPLEKRDYYPLSGAQKRMYLLKEFSGANDISYNMPKPLLLEGELDRRRIEQAFDRLVRRHEALRTGFKMVDGEPVQVIADHLDFSFQYSEATDDAKLIHRYINPFDLDRAPLFRVTLIKIGEDRHLLLFDIHHIISDGVTTGVLIQDFLRFYNNEPRPSLPVQYKDYAAWQRQRLESKAMERQALFWAEQFAEPVPPLELTTDFPRPSTQETHGGALEFLVPDEVLNRLERLGKSHDATLFMALLSCYYTLLYRYSGQQDMVVGFPIAGRSHQDLEGIAGIFINTLALRNAPDGGKRCDDFLAEVRDSAFAAYDNQEFQFEDLVDRVNVERRLDRNPLFDVMMIMQNIDQQKLEMEGLTISPLNFDSGVSRFDLTLAVLETTDGPRFSIEYSTALFRPETIRRMATHYVNILEAFSTKPEQQLKEIPMLGEGEIEELVQTLNNTTYQCLDIDLCAAVVSQAEATPHCLTLTAISSSGPMHLSYSELNNRASTVAIDLQNRGIREGDIVAVKMKREPLLLPILLGIMTAGAAYLPIDPSLPEERIRFMMADSNAILLIDNNDWGVLPNLDQPEIGNYEAGGLDRPAYVMYTSGSTGRPKGVEVCHRNVMNFLTAMKRRLDCAGGKILALTTISFDISVLELFLPLVSGMGVVLANEDQQKDANLLWRLLEREPVNILQITPSRLRAFLEHRLMKRIIADVPQVVVGGEALSDESFAVLASMGNSRQQVFNVYGPTETTVWSTIKHLVHGKSVTIGAPLDNTLIFIIDRDDNLLPRGAAGELCIGGLGVARGYLNRQELTADTFIIHEATGHLLYRTGDLAKWLPENDLCFLGRLDFQVKIRGFRIETGEIRHHLLRHPQITDALVHATGDSGDPILCAYIIPKDRSTEEKAELDMTLRRHLNKYLPEYMIPTFFVVIEAFPLTPSGKIDRRGLPVPGAGEGRDAIGPSSRLEESLLEIWTDVLVGSSSAGAAPFGVEDNFFAIGGHSLKALSLLSRISENHNVSMPMAELFRYPTIRAMAAFIEEAADSVGVCLQAGEELDYYPLSFHQERLWILQGLNPESTTYNMTQVLPLPVETPAEAITHAFDRLLERHDSLRTYFVEIEGEPVQRIARRLVVPLEICEADMKVDRAAALEKSSPFQLWKPPLMRLRLTRDEERLFLMVTMHHIIVDAWSMGILQQEFFHFLEVGVCGANRQLPGPPLQYKDFALWHIDKISDPTFKKQSMQFWVSRIDGGVPILEFPMAARGNLDDPQGMGYRSLLGKDFATSLEELAAARQTTAAVTLLAVFTVAMSILTRQRDVTCALITAGRDQEALNRTVGYFTGSLLFRVTVDQNEEFEDFLRRVGEEMMQVLEYQHFPLELAVQEAGMEMPRLQAAFNMLNVNSQRAEIRNMTPRLGFIEESVEAKFPVELYVEPSPEGMMLDWVFKRSLFDRDGIQYIAGAFEDVLTQILAVE